MRLLTLLSFVALFSSAAVAISSVPTDFSTTHNYSTFNESLAETTTAVHPAKLKWKSTEKFAKKITGQIIRHLLRFFVQDAQDMRLTSQCSRHMIKTLTGLKHMKLWAFQMLDASGKLPNGILSGTVNSLGDYDGCIGINASGQFQGQYCTLEIVPPLPERKPFENVDDEIPEFVNFTREDQNIVGEFLKKARHFYFLQLRTSVCVPSSCTIEDVDSIAQKIMNATELEWSVHVRNCEFKETLKFKTRDILIMCLLGAVFTCAFIGTAVDVVAKLSGKSKKYEKESNLVVRLLLCFSVYSNTLRLLKKDNSPDTIKIFHGMKVITVMWVILNHTYYYVNLQIFSSLLLARDVGRDLAFQFVLNGFLNVETFFFISAVLVIYVRMKVPDKHFTIAIYIFRRLWRLTPPFMFVIAVAFLTPYMGSGPVWKETVGHLIEKCDKNWWTNLLYFNNFVSSDEMCMQWMWYIPVDTHLYLLALVVIMPIKKHPRLGFIILGVILALSIAITAGNHVLFELTPTALYSYPHPDDITYYVNHGYFRTYLHATTYCIGMAAGYVLATRPKLRIPLPANIIGWIVSSVMALTVLYGVFEWNQGNVPSLAVSTLYACTNKLVWALALGWVVICCHTGNGGIITSILSWEAFVPLSRLTYMAYLIHPITQHMYIGSSRVMLYSEHKAMSFLFMGHVVAAYIGAYVFSQLFESPFMQMEKIMFPHVSIQDQPPNSPLAVNEDSNKQRNGSIFDKISNRKEENGVYGIKIRKTEFQS